jgi:hypothetical protein
MEAAQPQQPLTVKEGAASDASGAISGAIESNTAAAGTGNMVTDPTDSSAVSADRTDFKMATTTEIAHAVADEAVMRGLTDGEVITTSDQDAATCKVRFPPPVGELLRWYQLSLLPSMRAHAAERSMTTAIVMPTRQCGTSLFSCVHGRSIRRPNSPAVSPLFTHTNLCACGSLAARQV